jgi:FkbM family methyltransferase
LSAEPSRPAYRPIEPLIVPIPSSFRIKPPLIQLVRPEDFPPLYQVAVERPYDQLPLNSGDLVLDAGANIGVFALLASRAVGPKGLVVAVEPDPDNFARLEANLRLNQVTNVRAVRAALWRTEGFDLTVAGSGTMVRVVDRTASTSVHVPARTMQSLLDGLGIPRFSKVKMDIEGSEDQLFEDMESNPIARADGIVIEVHTESALARIRAQLAAGRFREVKGSWKTSVVPSIAGSVVRHPVLVGRLEAHNHFQSSIRLLSRALRRGDGPGFRSCVLTFERANGDGGWSRGAP